VSPTSTLRDQRREWIERNPLRKWRAAQDLTMADVASMMNVAFASVQLWETGGRFPSDDALGRMSELTGRSPGTLSRSFARWQGGQPR
jgi:transcriptional regulator with XRE-family HTH domain